MRAASALRLGAGDRAALEALIASPGSPPRAVCQARAILLAGDGIANEEIGRQVGVSANTVRAWRKLFGRGGVLALGVVSPGRGRKRSLPDEVVAEVIRLTEADHPDDGSLHWTTRSLARRVGIGKDSVARIWAEHTLGASGPARGEVAPRDGLPPVVGLAGLYLAPVARLAAFSIEAPGDERHQPDKAAGDAVSEPGASWPRPALDVLPAVLNIIEIAADAAGEWHRRPVVGSTEILELLDAVDAAVDNGQEVHLLATGLVAHKAADVTRWLLQPGRSRWRLHLCPTTSEWSELVRGWLTSLAARPPLGGAEHPLDSLVGAIESWMTQWSSDAPPFRWPAARRGAGPDPPSWGSDRATVGGAGSGAANSPERVAQELRRAILRGEVAPGEHVRQVEWARRLGVSRSALREGFKLLTGQRLLGYNPQVGYFVAKLSAAEMTQLYRLRRLVEEEILRSLRWPNSSELRVLEEEFARYHASLARGDVNAAIGHWRAYVFMLYSLSPLKFIVAEGVRLWEMTSPYRAVVLTTMYLEDPDLAEIAAARHDQLTALREHDRARLIESILHVHPPGTGDFVAHAAMFSRAPSEPGGMLPAMGTPPD